MNKQATHSVTLFPLASDGADRRAEADEPKPLWMGPLEELLSVKPNAQVDELLYPAHYLADEGRYGAALRSIQQVASRCGDAERVAQCCLEAGRIREQLGELEAAAFCYREAIGSDPRDQGTRYFVHNNLGYCLNRLRRPSDSEPFCRAAIAIDADRFNAHKNLGVSLELQGRFAEATGSYATAARTGPDDDRAPRRLRVLLARFPELRRDRPDLVDLLPPSTPLPESTSRQLAHFLASVRVEDPITAHGLQVFGLRWEVDGGLPYRTLDEALAADAIEITEVGDQGHVPLVQVLNRANERVLLMAGEEIVGAKQNRVLNASIMLGSRAEMPVPVSCVEQGRWAHRSRRFSTAGTSSHHALRYLMSKKMHASYRRHGSPVSDQGEVWGEVTRKLLAHAAASPSHALHDAYGSTDGRLSEVAEKITARPEWSGAVFAFGGAIAGLDLFDRPATLSKLWPKLLRGYAIDAIERPGKEPVSRDGVEDWLRGVRELAMEPFPSPGMGTDVRVDGERMVGAMLVVDDLPVHVEIFADDDM